jgi:hypothetical protein
VLKYRFSSQMQVFQCHADTKSVDPPTRLQFVSLKSVQSALYSHISVWLSLLNTNLIEYVIF